MKIGVVLMPSDPWVETVATAQRLENLGYDNIWVYDHLSWQRFRDDPWHATYPWLAGLAASTERIRFGTMVSNLNLRHPLLLAKDAMTIDHISNGRLTLGVGAGGVGFDASALGQQPLTPGQRIDRLEEYTPLLAGLLDGSIRNHVGEYFTVDEARLIPGCVQQPRVPIAVAAGGRRSLRLTAAAGDAWITQGDTAGQQPPETSTYEAVRVQSAQLDEFCEELGRDPASLDRTFMLGYGDEFVTGSPDAFEDFIGRYGELGFTEVVFHHPRPGDELWNEPVEVVEQIAEAHLSNRD